MDHSLSWTLALGTHPEELGMIPMFLSAHNPAPAAEQFNTMYRHGGGWNPMPGWRMVDGILHYPGDFGQDEIYPPLATTKLRDETISIHEHAWVSIMQPDGTFQVARMD